MKSFVKNYPLLLLIAAFSPYLSISLGIKVDNVVIFLGGILIIVLLLTQIELRVHKSLYNILLVWLMLFTYLFLRTLIGGGSLGLNAFVAEVKNFLQPLFLIGIFTFVLYKHDQKSARELMIKAGRLLILLLSLNTLWILLGFFVDLSIINQYFWRGLDSIASRAAQNGRFSGVFNQPIEAGMAYSIGLFVWVYLMDARGSKLKIKDVIALILIIAGGTLTVSKVFVTFGILLFVLYAISVKHIRKQFIKLVVLFSIISFPVYWYLTKTWSGLDYLLRLFDGDNYQQQGFLTLISAGRYGSEVSQQTQYFDRIMKDAPLIGEGMGSQEIYDSALFHAFSSGGLIALSLYIGILVALLWSSYQFYIYAPKSPEFKLYISLILITIVGGLGAPALTLNRSSIILWVFIGLTLQFLSLYVKEKRIKVVEKTEQSLLRTSQ